MDFIETIFGIAPDGGSGMLELLLLAIPVVGVCYVLVRRWRRHGLAVRRAIRDGLKNGSPRRRWLQEVNNVWPLTSHERWARDAPFDGAA